MDEKIEKEEEEEKLESKNNDLPIPIGLYNFEGCNYMNAVIQV